MLMSGCGVAGTGTEALEVTATTVSAALEEATGMGLRAGMNEAIQHMNAVATIATRTGAMSEVVAMASTKGAMSVATRLHLTGEHPASVTSYC